MKRLKAFTLIELIVAMAVIGILMTGIVRMVEPMSATAANSAVLNNQRNVENAICNYLGENLRYASNLAIIKGGTPDNAITKFIDMEPADKYGKQIDYTDPANKNKIHLIAFDCKTGHTYQNNTFNGRIISSIEGQGGTVTNLNNMASDGSKPIYMALGSDYYAQGNYFLDARICDNTLCLTVDSDFYYTPSTASKFSTTASAPTKGSYELRVMSDDSDCFVFACIDSGDTINDSLDTSQPARVTRMDREVIYFVYTYPEDDVTNNGIVASGTPGSGDANCPTIEGMAGGAGGSGGSGGNGGGNSGNNGNNGNNNNGNNSGDSGNGGVTGSIGQIPGGGESGGGESGGGESGGGESGGTTAEPVTIGSVTISGGLTGGDGVVGVIDAKENADGSVTITTTDKNGFNEGTFTITKDDNGNVVYTFTVGKNWWVFSDYMGVGWKNEGESFVLNSDQISYLESTYGISVN